MRVDGTIKADGILKTLRSLPAEIVSKRGGPVKLALAKGARFLRDKYKDALRAAIDVNGSRSTGGLEERVIASRGKAPNSGKGERYLVRVKKKPYVNADGELTNPLMTANLLEHGSSHQPATPFARPTVIQHGDQAINVTVEDLRRRVDLIVKKLAQQNKGR